MSVIVSDTSPIHYLILCEAEQMLPRLFQQVLIPPTVFSELQHANAPAKVRAWAQDLPPWVSIQSPAKLDLTIKVDRGELEAICLAREVKAAVLLMDDLKGRNAAIKYGLVVAGTLGVLEMAAGRGWLDLTATIEKLRQTNARLDAKLVVAALDREKMRRGQ